MKIIKNIFGNSKENKKTKSEIDKINWFGIVVEIQKNPTVNTEALQYIVNNSNNRK